MENAISMNDANSFVQLALGAIDIEQGFDLEHSVLDRLKLEKLKDFLSKSTTFVLNRLTQQLKRDVANATKVGDVLLEIDDVQFFEPRGRFKLIISTESLILEGKQFSCVVSLDNISHMSCIPSNCSAKKEGEDFLAVRFLQPVKINNKDVRHILGNLSKSPLKMALSTDGLRDIESLVVTKVLQNATAVRIVRPQKHLFQTVAQQKDYLRCYKGIQEGAIYPLENGVVFVKPLLFLPAEEISSLTAGRGGGAGNTRYVDLKIETVDDKEYEFTNIEREELAALQMYVKGYLEARSSREKDVARNTQRSSSGATSSSSEAVDLRDDAVQSLQQQPLDEDSDESEDDDYSPEGSDSSGSDEDNSGSSSDSGSGSDSDSDASGGGNQRRDKGGNNGTNKKKKTEKTSSKGEKKKVPHDSGSDSDGAGKVKANKMEKPASHVRDVKSEGDVVVGMTADAAPPLKKQQQSVRKPVGSTGSAKKTVAPKARGSASNNSSTDTSVTPVTVTIDDDQSVSFSVKRERSADAESKVCDLSGGGCTDEQVSKRERIEIEL